MLALTGMFLGRLLQTPVSISSFVLGAVGALSVLAAALFTYWTFNCWRLRYFLDDAKLVVRWGPVRHIVPLTLVERAFSGEEVERDPKIRGLNWVGYHVGSAKMASLGRVVFYSTHISPRELVYVVTPGLAYAISPSNPLGFLARLRELKQQLSPSSVRPMAERWSVMRLPIWRDRYAQFIILLGLLVNAAMFAYVTYFFPSLPELLPMHFTVFGDVDLIGYRSEVLKLPAMAFVVFASNLALAVVLHARERVAAYISLVTAGFIQVVFWVATVRIVY